MGTFCLLKESSYLHPPQDQSSLSLRAPALCHRCRGYSTSHWWMNTTLYLTYFHWWSVNSFSLNALLITFTKTNKQLKRAVLSFSRKVGGKSQEMTILNGAIQHNWISGQTWAAMGLVYLGFHYAIYEKASQAPKPSSSTTPHINLSCSSQLLSASKIILLIIHCPWPSNLQHKPHQNRDFVCLGHCCVPSPSICQMKEWVNNWTKNETKQSLICLCCHASPTEHGQNLSHHHDFKMPGSCMERLPLGEPWDAAPSTCPHSREKWKPMGWQEEQLHQTLASRL